MAGNRETTQGQSPASSNRRTPPRAVVHNTDDQGGGDRQEEHADEPQRSAAPPPRNANRAASSVPELKMPSRDLTAPKQVVIIDAGGRRLVVRSLNAMDRLNMYEAAGPVFSANQGWMGMVAVAMSCVEIDGDRLDKPMSAGEMKAAVARVEQDGLDAIQHVYSEVWGVGKEEDADTAKAKN